MITNEKPAGIVLCGGRSRRMGQEKYRLPFLGETLLQRICRILQPEVSRILVVAAVGQEILPLASDVEVLRDEIPDAGPLAGISKALTFLQLSPVASRTAFVTSCDVPLLKAEVIRMLQSNLSDDDDAVVVRDEDLIYPLCAVYRTGTATTAAGLLESGQRRAASFPKSLRTRWLSLDAVRAVDPNLTSLMNCNTPADVETALRCLNTERSAAET